MIKLGNKPLISVIVATHNRPTLLKRALASLFSQDFQDFEIILCADENSKETRDTAAESLRPQDSFVSALSLRGPAESRNIGIQLSSGKWVSFLDDDDTIDPSYLSNLTNILEKDAEVHFVNYTRIIEDRTVTGYPIAKETRKVEIANISSDNLYIGNFIPNNAVLIAAHIAKNHAFDPHLDSHEDWD